VTLRVEPQAIPELRLAYEDALIRVSAHLTRLRRDGVIQEPWLGDQISRDVHAAYNRMVMEAPDGPYNAMLAYEAELERVHAQLQQIEDSYRRNEGDNAARWGQA
jgi:hypothetical protein